MKNFKELFANKAYNSELLNASVQVSLPVSGHTLFLRFNSKDIIMEARYTGPTDPWLSSLCYLLIDKSLHDASLLDLSAWDLHFSNDQTFWDLKAEISQDIFIPALELLRAALNIFRGREYLYQESSPLLCRCFGVRESDLASFIKKEESPTLAHFCEKTKAGMGCRTCLPEITKRLDQQIPQSIKRIYKDKTHAEWMLLIDEALNKFPLKKDWSMEITGLKNNQVMISFDKDVSQKEKEEVNRKLQGFLAGAVDSDLSFFLRRS